LFLISIACPCTQALSELSLTSEVWRDFQGIADVGIHASRLRVPSPVYSSQLAKAGVLDLTGNALDEKRLRNLRDCLTSVPNVHTLKLKVVPLLTSCIRDDITLSLVLPVTEVAQIICAFEDLNELHLEGSFVLPMRDSISESFFGQMLEQAPQLRFLDLTGLLFFPHLEWLRRVWNKDFEKVFANVVAKARHSSLLLRKLGIRCEDRDPGPGKHYTPPAQVSTSDGQVHEIAIGMTEM
jgi:hypothetical protein